MIHLQLPEDLRDTPRRLPFYLAMEEYAARNLDGQYFFIWQVRPTVIFGRNQNPHSELNLDYCHRHNIQFYRRRSGGGCVYADMNNLMFSHVVDCSEVATTFNAYTSAVASMLRKLGLDAAAPSDRNDIMIGSRKVSGYAFYHVKNALTGASRGIVHGTMLYDVDRDTMCAVLTPSAEKLASNGVQSVRQRVTSISENLDISLADFRRFALKNLCTESHTLSRAEVAEIEKIEQEYYYPQWLGVDEPFVNCEK